MAAHSRVVRGNDVARKEMDEILSAERAAGDRLEGARAKAKEIVATAEKDAASSVDASVRAARDEAQAIARRVSLQNATLEDRVTAQAEAEIERIRASAEERRAEAVKAVVERVVKTIS